MNDILPTVQQFKDQIQHHLPGKEAHIDLSSNYAEKYATFPKVHKTAAVLILLYPEDNEWHLVFMKRSNHEADTKHAGQISFPGGQLEQDDISLEACAIRECEEEVGIIKSDVNIIGKLTPIYVFVSNFVVHPFLAYMDHKPTYLINESEVAKVISAPLQYLVMDSTRKSKDIKIGEYLLKDMVYFDLYGEVLWGATAMMANELFFMHKTLLSK